MYKVEHVTYAFLDVHTMMQSTQKVARQIMAIAVKQVDISAYKGLSLNLPIMHTRRVPAEPPKDQTEELHYSMELEAMTMQLPTEQK